MNANPFEHNIETTEIEGPIQGVDYDFALTRRTFVSVLGAGLAILTGPLAAIAQQRRGGRGGGGETRNLAARLHIGKDGVITVFTGKVEVGQGARAELSQAAAEELRVSAIQVQLVMADTALVPDDGITAGSRSTPSNVPVIRKAAAAARELLAQVASAKWNVDRSAVEVRDGKVFHAESKRSMTYAELAASEEATKGLEGAMPPGVTVTAVKEWKVLGSGVSRPNGREIVTGVHRYPSDIERTEMLRGKVLRPPTYGAKLVSVDLAPAKEMKGVIAIHDGNFAGVVASTTSQAEEALATIAKTAKWETSPHVSSKDLFNHLRDRASGGVPTNPFSEELANAAKKLRATYHVPYIQHAPMETRAAAAEWKDGKLTVWTGTQNPFGVRGELERAFRLSGGDVRVVTPDTGGGFGGKHSGECAVEAARLAQAAGKPVSLKWTREEEFTWAYFRPAAVIEAEATLDAKGALTSWHFVSINPGRSGVESPYRIAKSRSRDVGSDQVLRQGSYRALASTANNFARESFMDELAAAVGADPLEFRLAHLERGRLRTVLEEAANKFNWRERVKKKERDVGIGLACGTEKGSYVAACAEVAIDRAQNKFTVRRVCQAYECGTILNPANLRNQNEGAIIMGLGAVLREEMKFENGKITNAAFSEYRVPRFSDVPELDIHLLNPPDVASVGAGETPIIAVAPAVANAIFHATGERLRELPLRLPEKKSA